MTFGSADCAKRFGDIANKDITNKEKARDNFHLALSLYRQVHARRGEANCLELLGDIYSQEHDTERAREKYDGAISVFEELGDMESSQRIMQRRQQHQQQQPAAAAAAAGAAATATTTGVATAATAANIIHGGVNYLTM